MMEILLLLMGVCCMSAILVGAFFLLSKAESGSSGGNDLVLTEEQFALAKMIKGEKSADVKESGMIQGLYPGAQLKISKNANTAPPQKGFLLLEDASGTVVDVKGSGVITTK